MMQMPRTPVMRPPVRKEMWLGARLAKSLEGPTTLAPMLTLRGGDEQADEGEGGDDGGMEVGEKIDGGTRWDGRRLRLRRWCRLCRGRRRGSWLRGGRSSGLGFGSPGIWRSG